MGKYSGRRLYELFAARGFPGRKSARAGLCEQGLQALTLSRFLKWPPSTPSPSVKIACHLVSIL